jgi:hypothetical protein
MTRHIRAVVYARRLEEGAVKRIGKKEVAEL